MGSDASAAERTDGEDGGAVAHGVGSVRQLPVEQIRTSFAALRPGRLPPPNSPLADGPIRVVPTDDGHYEVLDGFKRLVRWRDAGRRTVPAIVESPLSAVDHARLMLVANAPPRTVTALDEARVVASLQADHHIKTRAIALLLGKRPHWVVRRLQLATRLSSRACTELARGRLRPSAAYALTSLPQEDQDLVLEAALQHGLSTTDTVVLVAAYRVADKVDRREILADPKQTLSPDPSPVLTPRATELEGRLAHFHRVLADIRTFTLPGDLADPERRRLEALQRSLYQDLVQTVSALESAGPRPAQTPADLEPRETSHPESGSHRVLPEGGPDVDCTASEVPFPPEATAQGGPAAADEEGDPTRDPAGDRTPARGVLRSAPDCPVRERVAQGGSARAARGGVHIAPQGGLPLQAGRVPRFYPGARTQGIDHLTHPPRDPGTGVSRRAHDPGRPRPPASHRPRHRS